MVCVPCAEGKDKEQPKTRVREVTFPKGKELQKVLKKASVFFV